MCIIIGDVHKFIDPCLKGLSFRKAYSSIYTLDDGGSDYSDYENKDEPETSSVDRNYSILI